MRPAADQTGPGTAWQAGDVPTPPRSRFGPAVILLVAALAVVAVAVTVARRDPPAPQVRLSLDRAGSAVSFGPDTVTVTPALTASPGAGDPAESFAVLGIEGPGLAPEAAGVAVDCATVDVGAHRAVVAVGGRRVAVPLGEADGSWRGLVGAVCWQQRLSRDVAVDLVPVGMAADRPGGRTLEVDLRVRNGTGERVGLVLTVPPAGGVLLRPDGVPDGAEDDRTTWVDPGRTEVLRRTLLVPCLPGGAGPWASLGLRFRRPAPVGSRWDAPEPPVRGPGYVTARLPEASATRLTAALRGVAAAAPRIASCR